MKQLLIYLIKLIHFLFIAFVVLVPFVGGECYLIYNFYLILFLFAHWLTNNSDCALTKLEAFLTGKDDKETFIGRIVKPVYEIKDRDIYILTFMLLVITFMRLKFQYNSFKGDMFLWNKLRYGC